MSPILKPVSRLMNQLSFRSKFLVLAVFFMVPLAGLSMRLSVNLHQETTQLERSRDGLQYLTKVTDLIEVMENYRSVTALDFLMSGSVYQASVELYREKAIEHIRALSAISTSEQQAFLVGIESSIDKARRLPLTEAAGIDGVFDVLTQPLKKLYRWRLKLTYEFIPLTSANEDVLNILEGVGYSEQYFNALSRAQVYGTFYLSRTFIDSRGIFLLEEVYRSLSRLVDDAIGKYDKTTLVLEASPQEEELSLLELQDRAQLTSIRQLHLVASHQLLSAREQLDDQLIQAIEMDADQSEFYQQNSKLMHLLYARVNQMFDLANELQNQRYQDTKNREYLFYGTSFVLLVGLIYFFIGTFAALNSNLLRLVRSARQVSQGDYQSEIRAYSSDELSVLAGAMNEMRIQLSDREKKLKEDARTDGLTQLNNRKYFDEMANVSLANAKRLKASISLVLMDIDRFKSINDTYGHQVGDDCLKVVAKVFASGYKRTSDITARYGGEEFVAVMYEQSEASARTFVDEIRERIEKTPVVSHGHHLNVTASFGLVTGIPAESLTVDKLVQLADEMLYQAKETGRNRVCHVTLNDLVAENI